MGKRLTVGLFLLSLFLGIMATPVMARRLPRVTGGGGKKVDSGVVTTSKGVTTAVKLRSDRRAVVLTFTNLSIASSVSYQLTYQSKGLSQGAQGSVTSGAADPVTRELLFGTCSAGVCRYDSGITNAKLTVTTKLKTGKKVVKTYRIKV